MATGHRMHVLPVAAALLGAVAWLFSGCTPEKQHYVPNTLGGELTPTMSTADITTLISDSGYTRYKVVTPLWQMFEDAEEPFWRFPEGIELEQYDHDMNHESNVVCDSAIYYSRKRMWRLDGNVVMVNTERDSFLTQQLFWEQTSRKIYTDSFIHIVRSDRVIEGYGFESDQNMLWYTVKTPTAILPASSMPGRKDKTDSIASDSVGRAAPSRRGNRQSDDAAKAVTMQDNDPTVEPFRHDEPAKRQPMKRNKSN